MAYTELNLGGGGQNMNRKFKTFGTLDPLKVHIQFNYLTSTTLSILQTKLANFFFILFTLKFQIRKV